MGVCPSPKAERPHATQYTASVYSSPCLGLGSQLSSGVGSGEKGGGNQNICPTEKAVGAGSAEGGKCMFLLESTFG